MVAAKTRTREGGVPIEFEILEIFRNFYHCTLMLIKQNDSTVKKSRKKIVKGFYHAISIYFVLFSTLKDKKLKRAL